MNLQHPLISWLDSLLIHHSERTVKELFIHRKCSSSSSFLLGTHKKQTNKRRLIVYSSEKTKTFLSFTVFFVVFFTYYLITLV